MTGSDDRERHARGVENHRPGTTVEAFYAPEDPARSFPVDVSTLRDGLLVLSAGLLTALGGLFLAVTSVLDALGV